MAKAIEKEAEWTSAEDFADYLAHLLRNFMAGGIYIETADEGSEVYVISGGEGSTGVFSVLVRPAEITVCGGE